MTTRPSACGGNTWVLQEIGYPPTTGKDAMSLPVESGYDVIVAGTGSIGQTVADWTRAAAGWTALAGSRCSKSPR